MTPAARPVTPSPNLSPDLLVVNAREIATMAAPIGAPSSREWQRSRGSRGPRRGASLGELGKVQSGALAASAGRVLAVGPEADILRRYPAGPATEVVDAGGGVITPGLVDAHTHLIFAGTREREFLFKLQGASYLDIQRAGGGIATTMRATREAAPEELRRLGLGHLGRMLAEGTTTAEVKSGYALTMDGEIKTLEVADDLARRQPVRLVPTLLGAHLIPPEYTGDDGRGGRGRRRDYVEMLNNELTPAVARRRLARFCDVFCEEDAFTLPESRSILETAKRWGLAPKIHADELSPLGGAQLAVEVGAVSADHLLCVDDAGIAALAASPTIAVLLPGTSFSLMSDKHAPARRLVEAGAAVALASDFNPGSSPVDSMVTVMALACRLLRLTPAEALVAATVNAACAVGLGDEVGSLEAGKAADLVVFDSPSAEYIPYHMGANLVEKVMVGGRVVFDRRAAVGPVTNP